LSAFDIQAAMSAHRLPPQHRWVSFAFDGHHVIGILARGLEDPTYAQCACASEDEVARRVAETLKALGG
jgi:hypothetical protein